MTTDEGRTVYWYRNIRLNFPDYLSIWSKIDRFHEWAEQNLSVMGFSVASRPTPFEVSDGCRVTADATSCLIELVGADARLPPELVDGLLAHLPTPRTAESSGIATYELSGDYDSLRRRLASRAIGSEWPYIVDCAYVLDALVEGTKWAFELGVVSEWELKDRLKQSRAHWHSSGWSIGSSDAPDVAVLIKGESAARNLSVTSPEDVEERLAGIARVISPMLATLGSSLMVEGEVNDDHV